jgi:hypothetical protein
MQKMEDEWPGIGHQADTPQPGVPFEAPASRQGLGFWDAARDAMDLMAGRTNAPDMFLKYAQELEEQRVHQAKLIRPTMVRLNREQARSLVQSLISPFISDTMFGSVKISASMGPQEVQYWEFYAQDPHNRALLCEELGELMCRSMAEFMGEP